MDRRFSCSQRKDCLFTSRTDERFFLILYIYDISNILDWDTNKNLILSTVLDPHYKLFYFDEFLHERFKDYLLMEAEKVALKTVEVFFIIK